MKELVKLFSVVLSIFAIFPMTLFAQATPDNVLFQEALQKYFNGELDSQTVERL